MADRNTTDVLHSDLSDEANIKWLYERFIPEIRAYLFPRISDEMKGRLDVDDLAHDAWIAAIDRVIADPAYRRNSAAFRGLLRVIAARDVSSAVEFNRREGRDVRREAKGSDEVVPTLADARQTPPDVAAATRELRHVVIGELLNEQDEKDRLINFLGIVLELKAPEIRDILLRLKKLEVYKDLKVESEPTIRTQIQRAKDRVARFLNMDE